MVLPERLAGRGAIALRSIGGGLPVGFNTVYLASSAAAAVPAQAMAIPKRASPPMVWGARYERLVSDMRSSPAPKFYSAGYCDATVVISCLARFLQLPPSGRRRYGRVSSTCRPAQRPYGPSR